MPKLKIALAQIFCEKGDWEGNLARIERYMRQAAEQGCDIVVFPEMSLSGYCEPARFRGIAQTLDSPHIRRFAELTDRYRIPASAGFIEENPQGKPFIAQVLARDGRIERAYRKMNVVDEEAEWFSPGTETTLFDLQLPGGNVRCALALCADSDRPDLFARMACQGAQVILHSSAPGLYTRRTTEEGWRDGFNWYTSHLAERLPTYARDHNLYIAVATQTGATIDEDFPGGSFVFAPDGSLLAAAEDWRETLLVHEIDLPDTG